MVGFLCSNGTYCNLDLKLRWCGVCSFEETVKEAYCMDGLCIVGVFGSRTLMNPSIRD